MTKLSNVILGLAITMMTSLASASGFTVFDNVQQCENARAANRAAVYTPTTKAPFQGGKGWVKKIVGTGGACLGKAHILEDGAPKNGKAVYVAEGFVYWEHTTGAFRMHDCSNPFGEIIFAGKKAEEKLVAAPCTDCNKTVTEEIVKITNVTRKCVVDGKEVAVVNGECKPAPLTVTVNTKVETHVDSSCSGTCATTKAVKQAEGCATPNCVPQIKATVHQERKARVCGIEFHRSLSDKTIIARLQLDASETHPGKMRIAKVEQFEGKALQVASVSLTHSTDCDVDQASVYQNLLAVMKKFNLPDDCIPVRKAI